MSHLVQISQHTDRKRWWILRRGDRAVSLTAVVIPDGTPPLSTEVRDAHGVRLLPDSIDVHEPGDGVPECPALVGSCGAGGVRLLGEVTVLHAWAAAGHDDRVITAELVAVANREWAAGGASS